MLAERKRTKEALVISQIHGKIVPYQRKGVKRHTLSKAFILEVIFMIIHVEGMMCTHCAARVEKACMAVAGTQSAKVDLKDKSVTVEGTASQEALKKAIIDAGYQVVG